MTLEEIKEQCILGKLGVFPGYDGFFKWNYATKQLDYENSNSEQFPAVLLKDWEIIKNSDKFYYVI